MQNWCKFRIKVKRIGAEIARSNGAIWDEFSEQRYHQSIQKGVSFDKLFGQHLKGATQLTLTDPYLRVFHQIRNLMEFIETVVKFKAPEDDVTVHIVTSPDDTRMEQQVQYLEQVQQNAESAGVRVTWEFDGTNTIHARHIVTDNGWKILLDRGLDIFQRFEMNDAFSLANRIQEQRACKAFEVTFIRNDAP